MKGARGINQGRSRRIDAEGSLKACINVDHIAEDRWGPPWVDVDYKGIEGSDWRELCDYYKEISRAAGVRKPSESQKARAFLEDEGGKR